MNWKQDVTGDGGARWAGSDSIYNVNQTPSFTGPFIGFGVILLALGLPLLVVGLAIGWSDLITEPMAGSLAYQRRDDPSWALLWIPVGAGLLLAGLNYLRLGSAPKWLGAGWRVVAADGNLSYDVAAGATLAGRRWAIPVADIASVEAGKTLEWENGRVYPGRNERLAIPQEEYQTFIMTTDGRRLVVHTVHAGREDTAALALSLRRWIAERAGGPTVAPAALPSPITEPGFSL